jgi:hypothetical protein
VLQFVYQPSEWNPSDLFTKQLGRILFQCHVQAVLGHRSVERDVVSEPQVSNLTQGDYSTQGGFEEALRTSAVLSFSQTVAAIGQGAGRT